MAEIERHPHWLARSLDEDFGIDAEAEYIPGEARGDVLKLQFKTTSNATLRRGRVRVSIDRKYMEYARACRYPVVFVLIDLQREEAWYVWLQEWLFHNQRHGPPVKPKSRATTIWVDARCTLADGLSAALQSVAQWRGPTQLALSLLDAFRAAMATHDQKILIALTDLLEKVAPALPDSAIDEVIEQANQLGNDLWGTQAGNTVALQLYRLVRQFGSRMSISSVDAMVCRDELYSRTGVNALGVLYDEHFEHARSLHLIKHFGDKGLSNVAFFCALREAYPAKRNLEFIDVPRDFKYDGLRFYFDENGPTTGFHDKFANRGFSAILDYLVPEDWQPTSA